MQRVADGGSALASLTEREHDVLAAVAGGHSNSAVAARMRMSERTVETHMRSIFQKLHIHDAHDRHRRVLAVLAYVGARDHTS